MAAKAFLVLMMPWGFSPFADDPFSGTWILNLSKSTIPPPAPKSQIRWEGLFDNWHTLCRYGRIPAPGPQYHQGRGEKGWQSDRE